MPIDRRHLIGSGLLALAAGTADPARARSEEQGTASPSRPVGALELAHLADAPSTPTGLAISRGGRVFVMMPRFTATVPVTVGEVMPDGSVRPYPDAESNRPDPKRPQASLFHVPNGVLDRDDTLWLLDAGLPEGKGAPVPGGAKLVQVDLGTNRVVRAVPLDAGIAPTSSLNDLRVGQLNGRPVAYITDQGQDGNGAIWRSISRAGWCYGGWPSMPAPSRRRAWSSSSSGAPVMQTQGDGPPQAPKGDANGIALSPDGARLYYAPLMGRRLYAVETAALLDPQASDATVAAGVKDLGEKGLTGGLTTDSKDRVYLSLQEQNAVGRRDPDGTVAVLAADERLVWADTFWITPERWLYISAAQVNRRPEFNDGQDLQKPPYAILRMRIDADPVDGV